MNVCLIGDLVDFIKELFVFPFPYYGLHHLVQQHLHEEPYTAAEIENLVSESLTSIMSDSPTSLAVLDAAKQFKLYQVSCLSNLVLPFKFITVQGRAAHFSKH